MGHDTEQPQQKNAQNLHIFQLKKKKNQEQLKQFLHFWEQRTQISTNAKQQHLKSHLKY